MRKKDRLYTVNKWNTPAFMPKENLFDDGGQIGFKDAFTKKGLEAAGKSLVGGLSGKLGTAVGGLAGNVIAGGLQSGAGSAISNLGGMAASAIGTVNPLAGAVVGVGSQLLGGLTNRAFGMKTDQAKLDAVNAGISQNQNFISDAGSFDAIQDPTATMTDTNVYKGGWFSGGKARKKNKMLKEQLLDSRQLAQRGVDNNIFNLQDDQINGALANYAAFGGPIDAGGAIEYGLMSDYLTMKKQQAEARNRLSGINSIPSFMPQTFALGGDLQTNGSDFTTGLTRIDAGSAHELNPNDGVQVGVDESGVPNLVEEGETIFDDYVYSTRILADATTKQMFRLPKKRDISFADISKKLEKEASERPNDPISQAGLKQQMHQLAEQQERQKQEMEAQKAKEAFEALSPEEQSAIMQQARPQLQNMAGIPMLDNQPSSLEAEDLQGINNAAINEPVVNAYGGKLYRDGGEIWKEISAHAGWKDYQDFYDWANANGLEGRNDWGQQQNDNNYKWLRLANSPEFMSYLKLKDPVFADVLGRGYNMRGQNLTPNILSIALGNWKGTNGAGWLGSTDPAFLQAVKGLGEDEIKKLTSSQLAKLMKETKAYKDTTEWLQNGDNALVYLNELLNNADTPEEAKAYARKYVENGNWKKGFNYDYNTVFGEVRGSEPGTYWHSVQIPKTVNTNYIVNDDGSVEEFGGSDLSGLHKLNSFNWGDSTANYNATYLRRPNEYHAMIDDDDIIQGELDGNLVDKEHHRKTLPNGDVIIYHNPTENPDKEIPKEDELSPVHLPDELRYAGLLGPAVGLGLMAAGVGKPNTSSLDAAIEGAGDVALANYKPLGNYLTYRPLDIWYGQNRLNANARATDRAILNSGANQGSKMAGLLAAGYNDQIASGELFRQAQEYNDNLRKQVADFNRGTDQFNADAYNRTSQFNANALNQGRQHRSSLALQAADKKMNANAGWAQGIYGNLSRLFKGISDLGRENKEANWRNALATADVFGVMDDDTLVRAGYAKRNKKSKGGKIKRGLTY